MFKVFSSINFSNYTAKTFFDISNEPYFVNIGFDVNYISSDDYWVRKYTMLSKKQPIIITNVGINKIQVYYGYGTIWVSFYKNTIVNTNYGIPCLVTIDDNKLNEGLSLYFCVANINKYNLSFLVLTNNIAQIFKIKKKYFYNKIPDEFADEYLEINNVETLLSYSNQYYNILYYLDRDNLVHNMTDVYFEYDLIEINNTIYYKPTNFDFNIYLKENEQLNVDIKQLDNNRFYTNYYWYINNFNNNNDNYYYLINNNECSIMPIYTLNYSDEEFISSLNNNLISNMLNFYKKGDNLPDIPFNERGWSEYEYSIFHFDALNNSDKNVKYNNINNIIKVQDNLKYNNIFNYFKNIYNDYNNFLLYYINRFIDLY